jgi:RNA polymerase-binding protein DksA
MREGRAGGQDGRERLKQELIVAVGRLREMGIATTHDGVPSADAQTVNDIGDVAQVSELRDLAVETRGRIAERISRITAALERVDEGTYGVCERCGEEIQAARLDAIPEAELCRDCQEVTERLEATTRPAST